MTATMTVCTSSRPQPRHTILLVRLKERLHSNNGCQLPRKSGCMAFGAQKKLLLHALPMGAQSSE